MAAFKTTTKTKWVFLLICSAGLLGVVIFAIQGNHDAPEPDKATSQDQRSVAQEQPVSGRLKETDNEIDRTAFKPPDLEDVDGMVAECYCHFFGAPDIPPFEIPKQHFAQILEILKGNEARPESRAQWHLNEFGTIRINLRGGGCIRVSWHIVAANAYMHFSCDGRRFVKTTLLSTELDGCVRGIYDSMKQAKGKRQ